MRVVGNAVYPYCHRTGFAMKIVALKMTLKRNFILNFYESAQCCNYRSGQPIAFIKSFPLVHCFQFKRRKFNQHQEMGTYSIALTFISVLPVP